MPRHLVSLLLVGLVWLAGCRSTPMGVTGADQPAMVRADVQVQVSSADSTAKRRVLVTPSYRSTHIEVEVTGAGYGAEQWLPVTPSDGTTGIFAHESAEGNGQNTRVAKVAGLVPAGNRRIFRVHVYDSGADPGLDLDATKPFKVEELWGVGDMVGGETNPVTISPIMTPTGKIFHKLIQIDSAKALTVPVLGVQGMVNRLLNTHHATGEALNPALPQISYAVLNTDMVAMAIVRGNNGMPFQVPDPIPQELLLRDPTNPVNQYLNPGAKIGGKVRFNVLDMHGQQAAGRPFLMLVSDPASKAAMVPATAPLDVTFDEVAPGRWMVEHTDLERGGKGSRMVTVTPGVTTPINTVAYPATEIVAGYFDADADKAYSFNDERVPAKLAFLGDAKGLVINNGVATFLDAANYRIRRFDLKEPNSPIRTIGGNGVYGHRGDQRPAESAWLRFNTRNDLVMDDKGVIYFTQDNLALRAITPSGIVRTLWSAGDPAVDKKYLLNLGYDETSQSLYAAIRTYGGFFCSNCGGYVLKFALNNTDPENPSLGGGSNIGLSYGGWLFTPSSTWFMKTTGSDTFVSRGWFTWQGVYENGTGLYRYNRVTGAQTRITGGTNRKDNGTDGKSWDDYYFAGDDIPASKHTERRFMGLAEDHMGNVFYGGNEGLMRITKLRSSTDPNDWRIKTVVADPNIRDVVFDRAPGENKLYILTTQTFNGKAVPVIKRVVP